MSGKKKKIYHQKFGQHILTKSKLPIPSRPPPAPRPNASKVSWLVTQSAQNQKQITRKKIKRRQIFRTGVDFFEIRFAKTVIEVNHGPGGHFVLLSSWKKFCVPGKIPRKRFVQFLEIIFEWITRDGIFLSFQPGIVSFSVCLQCFKNCLFQYRYFLFLAYTYFLLNRPSLYLAKFENSIENVAD